MTAKERLDAIKQTVMTEKKVFVSQLSEQFDVTEETIRRDLEKLEMQGMVMRTYGGAVMNAENIYGGISFYKRATVCLEAKQVIARKTAEFLQNTPTLAADSSSTVMETLRLLKDRRNMTLLTNSTEALRELSVGEISVVSTGGILNRNSLSLQGEITKNSIRNYNVDVMLMSCKGLDREKGALDSNEAEAEMKKAMAAQAAQTVLLLDHTKFGHAGFVQLAELDHIDYVITDKKPTEDWIRLFQKKQVQIFY